MPQEDDARFRSDGQSGQQHTFNHQVGKFSEQQAILERTWLTFVGVTDDVLRRFRFVSYQFPFATGGKAGSSHAAQAALVKSLNADGCHILPARDELPGGVVVFAGSGVRVATPGPWAFCIGRCSEW